MFQHLWNPCKSNESRQGNNVWHCVWVIFPTVKTTTESMTEKPSIHHVSNMYCVITNQPSFITIRYLTLADGESPSAEDLVQCNTCKRRFTHKVLVKNNHLLLIFNIHELRYSVMYCNNQEYGAAKAGKTDTFIVLSVCWGCSNNVFHSSYQLTWYQLFGCVICYNPNSQ